MLKKLLYTFMAFVLVASAKAQYPNYAFQAATGTFTAITGTPVVLNYGAAVNYDDGVATPANAVPIGFTFNYNGTDYTTIRPCANGWATFSSTALTANTDTWSNSLTSGPAANQRPLLAPLWDDLDMGVAGAVSYALTGSAPNRVLTLQWANAKWDYSALAASLSFQIKLYETTNVIEFVYRQEAGTVANTNGGASIGITATATGSGTFLSLSDASASPQTSFTTETSNIGTRPATGQIYRWSPYCTTSTNNHAGTELISRVQFGTIDNPSTSTAQYENFTNLSATVQTPSTVPITITLAGSYALDKVLVWIDFNHNGSFSDAGELVFSPANGAGPFTGNVTIPALGPNVLLGQTRMRIKLDDTGGAPSNITPCGLSDWGQVEDYTVNISLCTPASISAQPANTIVCNAGNGTISVTAAGTGLTYQWQISTNAGGTWTNLANTAPYSGVTTSTLTITGATTALNTNQYRVIINGQCTPANSPSNAATLTVNSPTAITTQPANVAACAGNNTSFTAAASNGATFQWQVSTDGGTTFTNIGGATSATLDLTGVTNAMNGNRYRFIATVASCNSVTSNAGTLTVNPLPAATLSVAPLTKLAPTLTTVLSVATTPSGTGATYNFYRNGVLAVANSTSASYTANVDGIGTWTATVTDSKGCTSPLSNSVTITDSVVDKLFIYPNPSRGIFHIRYYTPFFSYTPAGAVNRALIRTATIFDSKGRALFTRTFSAAAPYGSMDVDMRGYTKGLYFIDLKDVDGRRLIVGKILIQ